MILDVGHVQHRRRSACLCSERLLEWIRELGRDDPVERTRAVVLARLVLEHQQHFPSYVTAEIVVAERAGDDAEMCEHEIACRGGRRTVTVRIEAGGAVVPRRLTIARDGELVGARARRLCTEEGGKHERDHWQQTAHQISAGKACRRLCASNHGESMAAGLTAM